MLTDIKFKTKGTWPLYAFCNFKVINSNVLKSISNYKPY